MALILPYHSDPNRMEYIRKYRVDRRRRLRDAYLDDKFCLKYGALSFLELHHRNPNEKLNYMDVLWFWKEERRTIELAKCDTLCDSCHNRETPYSILLRKGWVGQRVT